MVDVVNTNTRTLKGFWERENARLIETAARVTVPTVISVRPKINMPLDLGIEGS